MKNTDWDKDQIRSLAGNSGKPLEVECAQAFLAPPNSEWTVELGSYFSDSSGKRELDVLAVREERIGGDADTTCRLRALLSCKGFPAARSPIAYSVSAGAVPTPSPWFLCEHRVSPHARHQGYGPLSELGAFITRTFMTRTGLAATRPLVAFDTFERVEGDPRPGKPGKPPKPVSVEYRRPADTRTGRRGDSEVYGAIDSALNAAVYWAQQDHQHSGGHVSLYLPICVLSIPFWEVCIDHGAIAVPEIRTNGYQTNSYPHTLGSRFERTNLTVAISTRAQLADLVGDLEHTFLMFRTTVGQFVAGWELH